MHGRLKVRTSEEQAERKRLEREKKLAMYKKGMELCLKKHNDREYDLEGLKMTEGILANNGDLTTLWSYRKNVLMSLEEGDDESVETQKRVERYLNELTLTEVCLKKNPKSYSSWHHRQWCLVRALNHHKLVDQKLSWNNELALCNQFLNSDERNFHCWKHRYFVIEAGQMNKQKELEFTRDKISSNFSNYSAWHYRSKLIEELYVSECGNKEKLDEMLSQEMELVENAVFTDPNDQSAWIYAKWFLIMYQKQRTVNQELLAKHLSNVLELSKMENDQNKWCLLRAVELMNVIDSESYKTTIVEYLDKLASQVDSYRSNYYTDLKRKATIN